MYGTQESAMGEAKRRQLIENMHKVDIIQVCNFDSRHGHKDPKLGQGWWKQGTSLVKKIMIGK